MDISINNDDQYKKCLQEIDFLMEKDPDIDTAEGEHLSVLALAIKKYEEKLLKKQKQLESEFDKMLQDNFMELLP